MKTDDYNVVHVGRLQPDATWHMQGHHHPFHELIVPVRGLIRVRVNHHEHACAPGTVLLYPAGVVHEEWSDPDAVLESYFVAFRCSELHADDLSTSEDPDGRIRQILRWMLQDQRALNPGGETILRHYLHLLIALFKQGWQPIENDWVQKILAHARHHLNDPLSLDDLAQEAGFSRFHFVREYRKLTGRTPMADVRRIRADYARELILTTGMPLKEVATAAGFANEYTLSRTFRALFNMPPGEFRRNRHLMVTGQTSVQNATNQKP